MSGQIMNDYYAGGETREVCTRLWGCEVLAWTRNGLVNGPFAKRPRPGNQSTLPASRVRVCIPSLHLSTLSSSPSPPKPSRLQALLDVTLAAEPSAVSNGRADLTVHTQPAHARAPYPPPEQRLSSCPVQHRLYLATAPPPQLTSSRSQTTIGCAALTPVLACSSVITPTNGPTTLVRWSPPNQVSLNDLDLDRCLFIDDQRALSFSASGFGLYCI